MNQSVPKICQEKTIVDLTKKTKQLLFMKKSILTSLALVLLAFAANAQAPTTTASHNVKIVAANVMDIAFETPGDYTFTFDTPTKYDDGIDSGPIGNLKVRSTKAWKVQVSTTQANFTADLVANNAEVANNKLTVTTDGTTYVPLATTAATIKTGSKGGLGVSGNVFQFGYKMNPGYIAPDNYTIPVTFTISAQ